MQVDITLKNYRCFSDTNPARISLRKGFIAFVGVNNAGKSSLLRFFYEFRSLFDMLSSPSGNLIRAANGTGQAFNFANSIVDQAEVFCNYNSRDIEIEFQIEHTTPSDLVPERLVIMIPRGTNLWTLKICSHGGLSNQTYNDFNHRTALTGDQGSNVELDPFFQAFQDISKTLYIGAFRNVINIGTNQNYFDIRIGQAFIDEWRNFKTGPLKRDNETAAQVTDAIRHIFGFNSLEINPSSDNSTLQVFVDGRSYRLHELGSGIAQFILTLVNVAVKQPSYILIDEPELNLHPSLQLDFLTSLGSFSKEGTLFATHSIGLARAGADLIYSVHREDGGNTVRPLETTPNLSEFLGELSFSGYRELGFDKILLAEGAKDVKTIQQFLRQYRKDHQIVLLPLGGSQLINQGSEAQLQEVKRISEHVFALIDSERSSDGAPLTTDRAAFVKTCDEVGITCHVLKRRAIENYLTDNAVKKVKGNKYRALMHYELLRDAPVAWAKEENWKIAREMSLEELEVTDLGQFLKSL